MSTTIAVLSPNIPSGFIYTKHKLSLALASLLLCTTATMLLSSVSVLAEETISTRQDYAIPAGSLGDVLAQFSAIAGTPLAFDPTLLRGLNSPGLRGNYSVEEGYTQLLENSGYELRHTAGQWQLVKRAPLTSLGTVKVSAEAEILVGDLAPAYSGGQVAQGARLGALGTRNLFEVPFSVIALTRDVIDNQQARTIADVVRNDASVTVMQGANSGGTDESYNIRGFRTFGSVATYDGLGGLIGRSQALEAIERVEILKGPSSFLNGAPNATVGGTINYVPKRATDTPLTRVNTRYYSDEVVGAHVDIGRRYGSDNRVGVRLNAALRDGDTPVNLTDKRNELVALALDYRGDTLRITGDLDYTYNHTNGRLGGTTLAAGVPVPAAPDNTSNWSQPWSRASQQKERGLIRTEWDFLRSSSSQWTLGAAYGQLDQRDAPYITCDPNVTDAQGNFSFSCNTGGTLNDTYTGDVSLKGHFATGFIQHNLRLGITRTQEDSHNNFINFAIPGNRGSNLYNPVYYTLPALPEVTFAGKTRRSLVETAYLADEMVMMDEQLRITLGGRQVKIDSGNYNATSGARTSFYIKDAFTPAAGGVYRLTPTISLYSNYAEALEESGTAPNTAINAREVLPPLRSKQLEAGVKVDMGKLALTLGAFEISKANTLMKDNLFTLDGEQVNQGIELTSFGELTDTLRLLASTAWIDAKQTRTAGGLLDGKHAFSVPELQANASLEWDPHWLTGLTLSAGLNHSSSSYLDADNTRKIPGWERLDLGARYAFEVGNNPAQLRVFMENASDENYWSGVDRGSLYLGQPRTLSLSLTIDL